MSRKPKTEPESLETDLKAFAKATLEHADRSLAVLDRRIAELGPEGFDKDLSMASAALIRARSAAVGELRQQERHDRTMAKTPEQRFKLVRAYLSEITAEQRAVLEADLEALRGTGSVLS